MEEAIRCNKEFDDSVSQALSFIARSVEAKVSAFVLAGHSGSPVERALP